MGYISDKIKEGIHKKKLTDTEFCRLVGIDRTTYYKWNEESIKISVLRKISNVLDIPICDFFAEEANPDTNTKAYKVAEQLKVLANELNPGYAKKQVKKKGRE
jgi:transcriptional regulator with XRE-family HTH domain